MTQKMINRIKRYNDFRNQKILIKALSNFNFPGKKSIEEIPVNYCRPFPKEFINRKGVITMTKLLAKELSLEVWKYLADHPEIERKQDLPFDIFNKIRMFEMYCPLCEFIQINGLTCRACPLGSCCGDSDYGLWLLSYTDDYRKYYATKIYEKILNWNIN